MSFTIKQLGPEEAEQLFRLRQRALLEEPFAFLSSPEDDLIQSPKEMRDHLASPRDGSTIIGALDGEELIGMVGITRDRHIKAAHRACVWGVYVDPERRRHGAGAALLKAAKEFARGVDGLNYLYLSVSEKTPAAKRLYESAGFVVWGLEPDCIRHDGETAREYHLSMAL